MPIGGLAIGEEEKAREIRGELSALARFGVARRRQCRLRQGMLKTGAKIADESVQAQISPHPSILTKLQPAYMTDLGAAYAADSLAVLTSLPKKSINAVITSPP